MYSVEIVSQIKKMGSGDACMYTRHNFLTATIRRRVLIPDFIIADVYVLPLQKSHHVGCFSHCNRLPRCTGFKSPADFPGSCDILLEPWSTSPDILFIFCHCRIDMNHLYITHKIPNKRSVNYVLCEKASRTSNKCMMRVWLDGSGVGVTKPISSVALFS